MPTFSTAEIGPIIAATLLAWLISGLVYSVLRFVESHWLASAASRLTCLALVFLFLVSPYNPGFEELGFIALPSLLGGWFHRRSGGASNFWFSAALLAMSATVISFASGVMLAESYWDKVFAPNLNYAQVAFVLGLVVYPNLVPLGIWLSRGLRVHPGYDVPLQDETWH